MLDSTTIIIPDKQLDSILSAIEHQTNEGLDSGEIAIIASLIGVLAALVPQLVVHYLEKRKEKIKLNKELIAEERRIAFLLAEYFKELVMYKVHKHYWYKAATMKEFSPADQEDSHKRHFSSNEKSFECNNKIRILMAKYFKAVEYFLIENNSNQLVIDSMKEIKKLKLRKPSEYEGIEQYSDLLVASEQDEKLLRIEYLKYSILFDRINAELKKQL